MKNIIDLTFLGTDNHRDTHLHTLNLSYTKLEELNPENVALRLFDGIGCQGTTKHPRPGNYTWNKDNFKKTPSYPSEMVSHHIAKATTDGMQSLLEEAIDYINFIIQKKNDEAHPNHINLKGYSRGADTCIRLANILYDLYPQIQINMFLLDPVPGPFHRDDDGSYIILGNVKNIELTYMLDETKPYLKPQHAGRIIIQNPLITNVTWHYLAGKHGACLYLNAQLPEEERVRSSFLLTQKYLKKFIYDTTHYQIHLPECYRDRSKKIEEQFWIKTQDNSENMSEEMLLQDTQITHQKAQNQLRFFDHKRTLVKKNHNVISSLYSKSNDSENLMEIHFLENQFKNARNFYHYHENYYHWLRSPWQIISDIVYRILEILQGKNMDEKTKIHPNHYAFVTIEKALNSDNLNTQKRLVTLNNTLKQLKEDKQDTFFKQHLLSFKDYQQKFIKDTLALCDDNQKKHIQENEQLFKQFLEAQKMVPILRQQYLNNPSKIKQCDALGSPSYLQSIINRSHTKKCSPKKLTLKESSQRTKRFTLDIQLRMEKR